MSLFTPKTTMTLKAFQQSFETNVLNVCDFSKNEETILSTTRMVETGKTDPKTGQEKMKRVWDGGKSQMDRSIGMIIATKLVDSHKAAGVVFDNSAMHLYDFPSRRDWVRDILPKMAHVGRDVDDPDPYSRMRKMCGSLMKVGTKLVNVGTEQEPRMKKVAVYIKTTSATPADLRIFAHLNWTAGQRFNKQAHHISATASFIADEMAMNEFYEIAEARHYDRIRRGEIGKPGSVMAGG